MFTQNWQFQYLGTFLYTLFHIKADIPINNFLGVYKRFLLITGKDSNRQNIYFLKDKRLEYLIILATFKSLPGENLFTFVRS
jgi:hypothetical protein